MRRDKRSLAADNRGMSLVEMVIVVAIMTVLTGVAAIGVSMALSKPVDECAEKIVSTLNGARITTMGKQEIKLRFVQNDNGVYLTETIKDASGATTTRPDLRIGQKGVVVRYKLVGDANYRELSGTSIELSFKRTTGGFNTLIESGSDTGDYCTEIQVSKAGKEKVIEIAYLTGKVTIIQ
ncbi:MAG: prepilin-type N-terminal cleavage/methylation domain-containing protein [Lachnoclostridium sp.]|nr:prepilin-type N-terminal cleavage/methylation domain-containing protein [Lachnospira sp.]MCM1246808.1 prepilin-type N-terminal cleavage/methylation domain-containing protein [Lachnoclostridium sp.]MCM1535405.1 prepilin-type N-terminal cleavage/methylation domain-containing protein [Clostridium sp.]